MDVMRTILKMKESKAFFLGGFLMILIYCFLFYSVDIEDDDAWDFGTVKAPPMPVPKAPLPIHNSPSQYSVNTLATEGRPQPPQLPRTTSSNFVSSSPYSSSSSSRVSEIMVCRLQ